MTSPVDAPIYVQPTLVVLIGFEKFAHDATALRESVTLRLDRRMPARAVGWPKLDGDPLVDADELAVNLTPLRDANFWDDLVLRGVVSPSTGDHPELQIVAVCNLANRSLVDVVNRVLPELVTQLKPIKDSGIALQLSLLTLGNLAADLDRAAIDPFELRMRMGTDAYGGVNVRHEWVLEGAQTILTGLLVSDLAQRLRMHWGATTPPDWVTIGASALAVDVPRMREYLRLLILRQLLAPLLGHPLAPDQRKARSEEMNVQVRSLREASLDEALSVSTAMKWRSERGTAGSDESDPPPVQTFSPLDKLRVAIREASADLPIQLADHYRLLHDMLAQRLAALVDAHYPGWLDAGCKQALVTPLLGSKELRSDEASLHEEPSSKPRSILDPLPLWSAGVPGVIISVEAALEALRVVQGPRSAELWWGDRRVLPLALHTDPYLMTIAHADSAQIQASVFQYTRLARTLASPIGLVLKLIPAWLLLTAVLSAIGLGEGWAALAAALLLSLVGASELLAWRFELSRVRQRLERQDERRLAGSVLALIAALLKEARAPLVSRLNQVQFNLRRLEVLLTQEDSAAQARLDEIESEYNTRTGPTIYWMADLAKCREWAAQAADQARQDQTLVALICQDTSLAQLHSLSCLKVLEQLRRRANALLEANFKDDLLSPDLLRGHPDHRSVLGDGRHWAWLYEKARPLGRAPGVAPSFVCIVGTGSAFVGKMAGDSWRDTWVEVDSRQGYETICVRSIC